MSIPASGPISMSMMNESIGRSPDTGNSILAGSAVPNVESLVYLAGRLGPLDQNAPHSFSEWYNYAPTTTTTSTTTTTTTSAGTTTTTTTAPTTTTTSTTTTTTTSTIECGAGITYSGDQAYPYTVNINLGTGTGLVEIDFEAFNAPDMFNITLDTTTYSSGYRGDSSYVFGGANRGAFTSSLTGKLDPFYATTYPDLTNYPTDGYPPVTAPGNGTFSFTKSTASPTNATLRVYAPQVITAWNATVFCPIPSTTTTTTVPPTTTTTTTTTSTTTTTTTVPSIAYCLGYDASDCCAAQNDYDINCP